MPAHDQREASPFAARSETLGAARRPEDDMRSPHPDRRSLAAGAALMLGLTLSANTSTANPVNTEALRPNALKEGFSANLEGSFSLSKGNVDLLDVGGAARLQYQTLYPQADKADKETPRHVSQQIFIQSSAQWSQSNGEDIVNQAFVHTRWTGMWRPRLGSEVFLQYQFNEFLRLKVRALAGTGVRADLIHSKPLMLWIGSGYMLEFTELTSIPGSLDPPNTLEHRWTNYVNLRLALLKDRLFIQNTVYAQPRFDKFKDVRILEDFGILAQVSERFGIGTKLTVLHDSAPPQGVKKTDLRLASTLNWSF